MCAEGAVGQHCTGGQEAELKAGSEVNMDEEGTGRHPPPLPHPRSSLEYFSTRDVVCVLQYVQSVSRMVLLL